MNTSANPSLRPKEGAPDSSVARRTSVRVQSQQKEAAAADQRFANIAGNPFYKIENDPNLSPQQKQEARVAALIFPGTREEVRERVRDYATFKEWIQDARERMNTELIQLSDTEAMAELQAVYQEMNTAFLDFDAKLNPLVEIIKAVQTLRNEGLTLDAFKEIQDDRKNEVTFKEEELKLRDEQNRLSQRDREIENQIAALNEQKGFFGFGGVKESARVEIARLEVERKSNADRRRTIHTELSELRSRSSQVSSKLNDYSAEKKKLRELLDLTGDEHRERQADLIKTALHFVKTSRERVGAIRGNIDQMTERYEHLYDANQTMGRLLANYVDAEKQAEAKNQEVRATLSPPEGDEDIISKHTREEQRNAIEQHMAALNNASTDTVSTYADLTGQEVRIRTMLAANQQQVHQIRTMQSKGVAGITDGIVSAISAVSLAALGELAAAAKQTLIEMGRVTNAIAADHAISTAMGVKETNQELLRALENLGTFGDVVTEATAITQEGLNETQKFMTEIRRLADEVRDDMDVQSSVHANVAGAARSSTEAPTAAAKPLFGV